MNEITIYWTRPKRVNGRLVPRKPIAIKDSNGEMLDIVDLRIQPAKPVPPVTWLVVKHANGGESWFRDPAISNEFADPSEKDPFKDPFDRSDCDGRD